MIKLEVTPYIAVKILRSDIVENLQYDGIAAIIEHYDSIGEDFDFDQSLFWSFHRYESARAALEDYDSNVVEEDEIEEKCEEWLNDYTICLRVDNDEVVVYTEF